VRALARITLASALVAGLFLPARARASNVYEIPDNGVEQVGRGGAWVARASDPLATYFNPAGLAGQGTQLTLQSNFVMHQTCFTRMRAAGDTSQDALADPASGLFPKVCSDAGPDVNPQGAGTLQLSDRVTVGFAVLGPAGRTSLTFPEFVEGSAGPEAAPQRYLVSRLRGLMLFPQVGVGIEPIAGLRVGASFQWGIARLRLASTTVALNADNLSTVNDVRGNLQVKDDFVPGFTLGAIYAPRRWLDIAGWYRFSDAVRARGDVGTAANYYSRDNARGDDSRVAYGDTIFDDCGTGTSSDRENKPCGAGGNATVKLPIPMEAKLGFRVHQPRPRPLAPELAQGTTVRAVRDPLRDDVFDAELDLTWANNSATQAVEVRFPGDDGGNGKLPVAGVPGVIPPNVDNLRGYKDTLGIRLGGDYNVLPDRLAVRAGGFFESRAEDPKYQNVDFAANYRVGFGLGASYRFRFGERVRLTLMAAYSHIFVGTSENLGPDGLRAVTGSPCNPTANVDGATCPNGQPKYRTNWPVNLGTITNDVHLLSGGAQVAF